MSVGDSVYSQKESLKNRMRTLNLAFMKCLFLEKEQKVATH